jgi:hypothetical protein
MRTFEDGLKVMEFTVDGERWTVVVEKIFHPTEEEVKSNEAFNETLGNWEPEKKKSTEPWVTLFISTKNKPPIGMWWAPIEQILGPHVSRKGWSKSLFVKIRRELTRCQLIRHEA